jgi:hypothetical protein
MHKRAIGATAVIGVAALLMSACGGSSTPTRDSVSLVADGPVVNIWTWPRR